METPRISVRIEGIKRGQPYNVVQITIDGISQMYFAKERSCFSHAMILKEVLGLHNISYREQKVWHDTGPNIQGERYLVSGMGMAVKFKGKEILFFGDSLDYGMGISEPDLEEIQKQHPDWTFSLSSPER